MKANNAFYRWRCFMALLTFILYFSQSYSQIWTPLGLGTNGTINALHVYYSELIAGGSFTTAGGQIVNRVASWDGTTWHALGLGTNEEIFAFTFYNSNLVAVGKFSVAGGISSNKVAMWNGSNWSSGSISTINGDVYCVTVFGSNLVIGGNFTSINGLAMNRIAMWNGTSWQPLGAFSNDVLALAVFNSVLYAGGSFAEVHGNRISYWSGTKWNQVGAGIDDGVVYTLKTYGTSLAVGGTFTEIGQTTVNRIARWTGGSWASLGSGFDNGVYTLYSYGISLYAGGIFEHADNLPASKVAVYNGSGWSAITSGIGGINPVVKSIVSYGGRTVFAGKFSTAGGTTANNIAGWGPPLGIYPVEGPVPDEYSLQQNYPNPFNPLTKIRFAVPVSNDGLPEYVRLSVFNLLGGEVSVLVNERLKPGNYEVNFDGINLPSGTYFYRLVTPGFSMTKRMVLLK